MSVFYRKEYYREKLFLNNLHLKACRKKLQDILPYKCSKIDYIEAFKECFPHIWEDIVFFCKIRKNDYYRRKRKGLRTVKFFDPQRYLLQHCPYNNDYESHLLEEEKV